MCNGFIHMYSMYMHEYKRFNYIEGDFRSFIKFIAFFRKIFLEQIRNNLTVI